MINTKMKENWVGFEMLTKMSFKGRSTNFNMMSTLRQQAKKNWGRDRPGKRYGDEF
jgi:hypothetical protein